MSVPSVHCLVPLALGVAVWLCEVSVTAETHVKVDSHGYILYCPCLGRFGNQADTLLAMLPFSKALNRTLVLPHWVEFRSYGKSGNSVQVPFVKYFKVKPLENYHRVVTMTTFMRYLAPTIWPPSARRVTCFGPRDGPKRNDCNAKYGSPSTPFWATFNVDFIGSEFYESIITSITDYDLDNANVVAKWMHRFRSEQYPVIAFLGAPVLMPVDPRYNPLQGLLVWSDSVRNQAEGFVSNNIPSKPFLGIHVRHGEDWARFCYKYVSKPRSWNERSYFLAHQCLGNKNKQGMLTMDICMPPDELITRQVERTLIKIKAASLFVASNDRSVVAELKRYFEKMKVSVVRLQSPSPHVDLAILAMADHFIGNCVSTFTTFVVRDRHIRDRTVSFWGFEKILKHDEL